jgi:hypothetical protein
VEVDGNATYPGDLIFTRPGTSVNKITIRGIRVNGLRPVISGGTNTVEFRLSITTSSKVSTWAGAFAGFITTLTTSPCVTVLFTIALLTEFLEQTRDPVHS